MRIIYMVVAPFYDLKDPVKFDHTKDGDIPKEYHLYNAGDVYPRIGAPLPDASRVQELASDMNAQGKPLIEPFEIPDEPETPEIQETPENQETAGGHEEKDAAEPAKTEKPAPKAEKPKKRSAK